MVRNGRIATALVRVQSSRTVRHFFKLNRPGCAIGPPAGVERLRTRLKNVTWLTGARSRRGEVTCIRILNWVRRNSANSDSTGQPHYREDKSKQNDLSAETAVPVRGDCSKFLTSSIVMNHHDEKGSTSRRRHFSR
ncbi:hypothetical protein CSUI_003591 [Cystoisospora suis]|uniref:Uncharacterized protein n=1 Tax=Cystoisospora suis TaxID=483139 RepID=A0A2C6L4I8_9APIC|nr:hypothetical protein CSUI_003591 [Cystoisospora suis]